MEPEKFEAFTKAIATATSRRQALRRIGAMLGGTALAGLFPGLAKADNSACAHFCAKVFGADTPAAGRCTRDAAHHKGLCYTCGPASPGGEKPICCPHHRNGTCTSYSSATCCADGQVCQNGTCVTPTTTTTAPPTTTSAPPTTTTVPPTTTTSPPPTTTTGVPAYTGITPWG
jgi:cell division septation protein DedD